MSEFTEEEIEAWSKKAWDTLQKEGITPDQFLVISPVLIVAAFQVAGQGDIRDFAEEIKRLIINLYLEEAVKVKEIPSPSGIG